jgi:hypothetical protein
MHRIIFLCLSLSLIQPLRASQTDLVDMINEFRSERGLTTLFYEANLARTAAEYASILVEQGQISHIDDQGNRVLNRYKAVGGTAVKAGEILGTAVELSEIFTAWIESESHYQQIINRDWRRIGCSILEKNGVFVAVVLFSNSLIESFSIHPGDTSLRLSIVPVDKKYSLKFSDNFSNKGDSIFEEGREHYELVIEKEDLPLLLSIYGESYGIKDLSDFLYIPDDLLKKNH